jgi:hypothetical protein
MTAAYGAGFPTLETPDRCLKDRVHLSSAVATDSDFQRNLAIEELIIERTNPPGLEDFIRRAVAEHELYLKAKEAQSGLYQDIIQESKRFSMSHLQFRSFMRRCENLRASLLRELEAAVADANIVLQTKSQLDKVFTRHIRRAMEVMELQPPTTAS